MEILRFQTPYLQSNTYLLAENGRGILIDPCELDAVKQAIAARGLSLDYAILTHEHCDHITGVDWAKSLGARILCTEVCANGVCDERKNLSRYYDALCTVCDAFITDTCASMTPFICEADETFAGERLLHWQGHELLLRETPGHSAGGMCILADDAFLFCGDTILENLSTQTARFFGGSDKAFTGSTMAWLLCLNHDIIVHPGHFTPFFLNDRLAKAY